MSFCNKVSFRKLEKRDLTLLYKWLNTDFVIEWYGKGGSSYEAVVSKYLPRIKGEQPTYSFVIIYGNKDIGYIQTYMIDDYPEYSRYINAGERAAGMDLFIGESDFIHKGIGDLILSEFLNHYVFKLNDAECCIVGPEPKNKTAIKAYGRSGFKYYKTIQIPDEDESEYLMRIYKTDIIKGH